MNIKFRRYIFILALLILAVMATASVSYGAAPSHTAKDVKVRTAKTIEDVSEIAGRSEEKEETSEICSNNRILLKTDDSDVTSFGAIKAAYYRGRYIFRYASDEDTKEAFRKLIQKYGEEKVMLDISLKNDAYGWGTGEMYLSREIEKVSRVYGDNKVTVAVLDSGINQDHIIFEGKTISDKSCSFTVPEGSEEEHVPEYEDDSGHGTAVAGIIAESTSDNIELMIIKITDDDGNISYIDAELALEYAVDNGADVVNMSFSSMVEVYFTDLRSLIPDIDTDALWEEHFLEPIRAANEKGAYLVAAAGNNGADIVGNKVYPACAPGVITVGALTMKNHRIGEVASFSNNGESLDFVAAGEDVTVADHEYFDDVRKDSGTSFAAPYISASAALLLAEDPDASQDEITQRLIDISRDFSTEGWDRYTGYGMPVFPEYSKYTAKMNFVSGTEGVELENLALLTPASDITGLLDGEKVSVPEVLVTEVKGNDGGLWTFQGWDKEEAVINGEDVEFTGTWTYEEYTDRISLMQTQINNIPAVTYTGEEHKPDIVLKYQQEPLIEGVDYDIVYGNITEPTQGEVTIIGKGRFVGGLTRTFRIEKVNMADLSPELEKTAYPYTGEEITPRVIVSFNGRRLVKGRDYTVEFSNNIEEGEGKARVYGKGNFRSSTTLYFNIVKNISLAEVEFPDETYDYTGEEIKPVPVKVTYKNEEPEPGEDYDITYENNIDAGTAKVVLTGKADYLGTYEHEFEIRPVDINETDIELEYTEHPYTGEELKPKVTITYNGKALIQGEDYTVKYVKNISRGWATVEIDADSKELDRHNFYSAALIDFKILRDDISDAEVEMSGTVFTYTGQDIEPVISVKKDGKELIKDEEYYVQYTKNNLVGTATARIAGKGNYDGQIYKLFTINPKPSKIISLKPVKPSKKAKTRKLTVKWQKVPDQIDGYYIQYSLKKNMSGSKSKKITKPATVKTTLTKLKAKKKYYVRIKTYKIIRGKNYQSAWSKNIAVKTK